MAQVHYGLRPRNLSAEFGRWSLQGRFDWHEWDGEFVVRSDRTAATYLLSAPAGETLKAMQGGATFLDEIASHVFRDTAPPSAAMAALVAAFAESVDDAQSLLTVLKELEALGLARVDLA
jgi:hypothetical protein